MNLEEAVSEVGLLLNDANHDRWSIDKIMFQLNEGQKAVQSDARFLKDSETLTPTADVAAVSLNARVMDIIRVSIQRSNGKIVPLDGTSKEALDFDEPNWQNLDSGTPRKWWFEARTNTLNLVPPPDSANAITNGLIVDEIQFMATITYPSDSLFEGIGSTSPYHKSVVHYATAALWMQDATPEALAKAKFHMSGDMDSPGQYELYMKKIMRRYDNPTDVPARIKWRPQGGRLGRTGTYSKDNPMGL